MDAAGAAPPYELDGVSLLPVLQRRRASSAGPRPCCRPVPRSEYEGDRSALAEPADRGWLYRGYRDQRWTYVRYPDPSGAETPAFEELYDRRTTRTCCTTSRRTPPRRRARGGAGPREGPGGVLRVRTATRRGAPIRLVRAEGRPQSPIPRASSASPVARAWATERITSGTSRARGSRSRPRARAASPVCRARSSVVGHGPDHQRERQPDPLGVDPDPAQRADAPGDRVEHLVDRRGRGQHRREQHQREQVGWSPRPPAPTPAARWCTPPSAPRPPAGRAAYRSSGRSPAPDHTASGDGDRERAATAAAGRGSATTTMLATSRPSSFAPAGSRCSQVVPGR